GLSGDGCHSLAAGGQGRAIKENLSSDASAEQWARACVGGGFPIPELRIAERYEWQVRPSLVAPRQVLARPFSRVAVDASVAFIDIPPGDPLTVRLQMGLFAFGWESVTQRVAGIDAGYSQLGIEAIAARLIAPRQGPIARTDAVVDILAVGGWIADPADSTAMQQMVVVFTPARVRALRLGSQHLLFDGDLEVM